MVLVFLIGKLLIGSLQNKFNFFSCQGQKEGVCATFGTSPHQTPSTNPPVFQLEELLVFPGVHLIHLIHILHTVVGERVWTHLQMTSEAFSLDIGYEALIVLSFDFLIDFCHHILALGNVRNTLRDLPTPQHSKGTAMIATQRFQPIVSCQFIYTNLITSKITSILVSHSHQQTDCSRNTAFQLFLQNSYVVTVNFTNHYVWLNQVIDAVFHVRKGRAKYCKYNRCVLKYAPQVHHNSSSMWLFTGDIKILYA